ncbi:MAG: VWA domain-containing protein [Propionibacteriaceae bacterium]|nr:VWA domain-containing protein [Propionibacteriaceae bacterium]
MIFGLEFMDPWRLLILLLIPLVIAAYIWALKRKKKTGMRYTNTTLVAQVMPKQSQWRRHLALALSLLSLGALSIAWARPIGTEMAPRERATIVLLIDVSRSMSATDIAPTRLDAAKAAALSFLDELPKQYNVSVVSLALSADGLVPPTTDRTMVTTAINSLDYEDSTAIGEGIRLAMDELGRAPKGDDESNAPGAIVLMSDGGDNWGYSPKLAAQECATKHWPIYSVAYGTDTGYVDFEGQRNPVPPDTALLGEISSITGGKLYTAQDADQINRIYESISSQVGQVPVEKEVTAQWAGYGLAFAVVAALAAVSLAARWP